MNIYSVDLVRFGFKIPKTELVQFKIKNGLSRMFLVGPKCRKPRKKDNAHFHYQSQLIGVPRSIDDFHKILNIIAEIKGVLSYIEFSCDTVFLSQDKASDVFSKLLDQVYIAHICPDYIYIKSDPEKDFFDGRCLIIGKRNNIQYSMYPRLHKLSKEPVLRREFKILGHTNLLNILNLNHESEINDPEAIFKFLEKKYYRTAKLIDVRVRIFTNYFKKYSQTSRCWEFKKFLADEKNSKLNNPSIKSQRILNRSFYYYITPFYENIDLNQSL